MTAAAGLVVRGLEVDYPTGHGPVPALRGVDLSIEPGEAAAVVGESGCGKSTLGLAVTRLLPPGATVRGHVHLDGRDVLALDGAERRRWWADDVGMVFQDPVGALNPTMRVGAQVAEVLRVRGLARRAARIAALDLLERVALTPPEAIARRYPHQLSGGQQQRVVIAMALASRPRLLVLDEPTTGLDVTVEAEVLELVAGLRRELDAAVLFVTHDLSLVPTVCDRVTVLYAGEVVEAGDVTAVLANPEHPYTRGLLASVPQPGITKHVARLTGIDGAPPRPGSAGVGCAFAARCGHAVEACTSAAVPVLERPDGRALRCVRAGDLRFEGAPLRPRDEPPVDEPTHASHVADDPAVGLDAPLLAARGLTKRYGSVTALDRVDVRIGRGEVVGLVGESGSGKSTLARVIVGLTAPNEGSVVLDGRTLDPDVRRRSDDERRAVQIVFQHPDATLNPRHRVREVLARAIRTLGGTRSVEQLADECHLDRSLLDRRTSRLSGGQQQRVAIARALAGDPQLVVCDEPVSALDVSVQAGILGLFVDLQRERGTSALFISHDLAVVEYVADRIVVMYRGRVVEQGPAAQVLAPPHHPYTAELLAARRRVADRDDADAPLTSTVAPASTGCPFASRCRHAIPGRCDRVEPPVRRLGPDHVIACHLDLGPTAPAPNTAPAPDRVDELATP